MPPPIWQKGLITRSIKCQWHIAISSGPGIWIAAQSLYLFYMWSSTSFIYWSPSQRMDKWGVGKRWTDTGDNRDAKLFSGNRLGLSLYYWMMIFTCGNCPSNCSIWITFSHARESKSSFDLSWTELFSAVCLKEFQYVVKYGLWFDIIKRQTTIKPKWLCFIISYEFVIGNKKKIGVMLLQSLIKQPALNSINGL